MDAQTYKTTDMDLAATLRAKGFRVIDLGKQISMTQSLQSARVFTCFIFDKSDDLDQTVRDYDNDEIREEPKRLFRARREIQKRIHSEA